MIISKKNYKNRILNHITINGNKRTSEKLLLKTLKLMQATHQKKDFEAILRTSLINSSPSLYIKQIKRRRRHVVEFPFLLSSKLKITYALKCLISNTRKNSSKAFYESFNTELVDSSRKTSSTYKQKIDLHKTGFIKRKFANYRWFK